jgi:hypothetical protein
VCEFPADAKIANARIDQLPDVLPPTVDDRLAFPARQGLCNLAMFPERDRQDDRVGLEDLREYPSR